MKKQLLNYFSIVAALLFIAGTMNAQVNLLQGADMESETGWTKSLLNTDPLQEPTVTWNYTTDVPTAGTGGALHITGTTTADNSQVAFYQSVTLEAGKTYTLDAAFKEIQVNRSWCEAFLGIKPIDGEEYNTEDGALLVGLGTWAAYSKDDGEFSKDIDVFNTFVPDTSGTYYFVIKAGTTTWDGAPQTFEIILDELLLTDRAKPIVKFSSDLGTAFPNDEIQFTDESIYPVSWSWDFGDGTSSTDQNPTHAYAAAGKYTVSLAVTNELGATTRVMTDMIEITDPPVEVTAGGLLKGGEMESDSEWSISFLNNSGASPTATWNYTTDGPTAGTGGNLQVTGTGAGSNVQYAIYQPVHLSIDSIYSFEGAFKAISLANSWCEVFIGSQPVDGLDYGSGEFAVAKFSHWSPPAKPDGTYSIDASEYNQFVPDTTGTYYFVLKVGCTGDGNFEVLVDELSLTDSREKPHTDFSSANAVGFAPLTVDFENETKFATSYLWDFGDGTGTSTEENPSYTYDTPGTYTVMLTATNELGDSVVTKADFVKANEKPELPAGEKLYGGNMEDPNLWNITYLSTDVEPVPTGTWNYTDASAAQGAGGALHIMGDATNGTAHYCIWQPVELHKDSVYHFDGAFKAISALDHHWAEVYIGTEAPVDGADYGADSIKITYFNTWESCGGSGVDGTFMENGCVSIDGFRPTETGTYYFVMKTGVTDWEGNSYPFEVLFDEFTLQESTFVEAPDADFFTDVTSGDAPLTVYFTDLSTNAISWSWDFGDGGTSTEQSPNHTYTTAGVYTVRLVASNGNVAVNDTLVVTNLITVNAVSARDMMAAGLKVYPNPSNGKVTIELPAEYEGSLKVLGMTGNLVRELRFKMQQESVELEIDQPGVYILQIDTEAQSHTGRLIIR